MKALSRQWLEYAVVCVNYADTPANAKRILQVIQLYNYIIVLKINTNLIRFIQNIF